ncbi:hypothetical protein V494_01435 [Pseudogymnoascus sp. VKM F-4513 (FW-928)]|nr:hypothetical protein V494_01435 [Pseudogymnoascus sp. VKM F-4513 (FW-928)]
MDAGSNCPNYLESIAVCDGYSHGQLRLAPPRAPRDYAAKNRAIAVHHPNALLAETRDEDAAVIFAAAKLADQTGSGVAIDAGLGENGEAGGAEGGGGVQD